MSNQTRVELSPAVREFLEQPHFAVVATIGRDGIPHQTVMWYRLDGDDLVMSTPVGSLKHKHLQRDSRMSVCVEDGFRYVTLTGTVELDESEGAKAVYGTVGERYRGVFARYAPPKPSPQNADLLSRARVLMRMRIEGAHSSGIE